MPSFRRSSLANRTQNSNGNNISNSGQQRANHNSCTAENSSLNSNFGNSVGSFHSDPSIPKHISISYPSSDHALVYETVVLVFSLSAFSLQLLHLYRTVWWLPQSYTQFALKFYLVNPYLIGFVLTLLFPRWLWTVCKTSVDFLLPIRWQRKTKYHIQTIVLLCSCLAHVYCAALVVLEAASNENLIEMGYLRICCLLYPAGVLILIYKTDIRRYLELVPDSHCAEGNQPDTQTIDVQHQCSNDPLKVRQEVEWLRNDFNARLQNVLLHAYNMALACTLFPCCFVQSFIHFDMAIAIQHILLVWAGGITINAIYAFPPKYCDILHRAAKHLGNWDYVGTYSPTNAGVSCVDWCPRTIWKQGSLVRLESEVYRARGEFNSAQPGIAHHERFYALFINAALFQVCLLVFQLMLVVIQFVLLLRSSEWYQMISLSLLQASGGYALFKLTRDSVVVWRLSLAEDMLKNA